MLTIASTIHATRAGMLLASNGKQVSVIGGPAYATAAGRGGRVLSANALVSRRRCRLDSGGSRFRPRASARPPASALLVLCGKQPRPGRYRFRRNAAMRFTTARSLLLVQTNSMAHRAAGARRLPLGLGEQ